MTIWTIMFPRVGNLFIDVLIACMVWPITISIGLAAMAVALILMILVKITPPIAAFLYRRWVVLYDSWRDKERRSRSAAG